LAVGGKGMVRIAVIQHSVQNLSGDSKGESARAISCLDEGAK